MPELPEVETIVRQLQQSSLITKTIADVQIFWSRTLVGDIAAVRQQLMGQVLCKVKRRGKYVLLHCSTDTLVVHLRMTGRFYIASTTLPPQPYERARLLFEDGQALCFQDTRKFGRWQLVSDATQHLAHIGVEPLSENFTLTHLTQLVKRSRTAIKAFLLNQLQIAGLGNIYVDEALWEACIHPATPACKLTPNALEALHSAIIAVLERGITYGGTSLGKGRGNYYNVQGTLGGHQHQLNVFRRHGKPCPRCQTTLAKMVLAQRGTHYCPHCQINAD